MSDNPVTNKLRMSSNLILMSKVTEQNEALLLKVAELRKELDRHKEAILKIDEWFLDTEGNDVRKSVYCPICGGYYRMDGHKPDCVAKEVREKKSE